MAETKRRTTYIKIAIVLGTIALGVLGALYDRYLEKPTVEDIGPKPVVINPDKWSKSPDFSFTDIDGSTHHIGDFKGKIVLIDFWATWCPTCLVEFPGIVRFVESHHGDVILIALSSDSGVAPIKEFITKQPSDIQKTLSQPFVHVALDANRTITRDKFFTVMYPETIFIAPDQKMVHKSVGTTEWESPEMKDFFKALSQVKAD